MPRPRRLQASQVRLYWTLRTAHLERAHETPHVAIVHTKTRDDFESSLLQGLEVVQSSPVRAALIIASSRIEVLEVTEPLMTSSVRMTALAIGAVRLRGLLSRRRTRIVSYAIANADPWSGPRAGGLRARLRGRIERLLAEWIWSQLDRVCFGTSDADLTYRRLLRRRVPERRVIPALPAPREGWEPTRGDQVVFLGALTQRKGFDLVLRAWAEVRRHSPTTSLVVLGKGALEAAAHRAAAIDSRVTVVVDPAREEIFDVLRRSRVLVLPSQPTPHWREQVGLPIVEGLSAGCLVVTTSETGLASWLVDHGHSVIPPTSPPSAVAAAIIQQLESQRMPADVIASLPAEDGRLAADSWMFGEGPSRRPPGGHGA